MLRGAVSACACMLFIRSPCTLQWPSSLCPRGWVVLQAGRGRGVRCTPLTCQDELLVRVCAHGASQAAQTARMSCQRAVHMLCAAASVAAWTVRANFL